MAGGFVEALRIRRAVVTGWSDGRLPAATLVFGCRSASVPAVGAVGPRRGSTLPTAPARAPTCRSAPHNNKSHSSLL